MGERKIDEALVTQTLRGDKEAFDVLVRKYQHKLQQSIMRYVTDPQEAMDVVQDAFIRAYSALSTFRGDSVFYTWIYRITTNTAKNYLKARDRRPPDVDLDFDTASRSSGHESLEENKTPEEILMCDEMESALLEAVNGLPEGLRASILLREIGGLSYEEIAETLHIPVGTVRSRIFRARATVDAQLKSYRD